MKRIYCSLVCNFQASACSLALLFFVLGCFAAEEPFQASTTNRIVKSQPDPKRPKDTHAITLRVGEIKQVHESKVSKPAIQTAFYLPKEAASLAQVIIERKGRDCTYFLKGLAPGQTVGGVVAADLLDTKGFLPRNEADEARIQKVINATPWFIQVIAADDSSNKGKP